MRYSRYCVGKVAKYCALCAWRELCDASHVVQAMRCRLRVVSYACDNSDAHSDVFLLLSAHLQLYAVPVRSATRSKRVE
eukprot:3525713-Pyramimonas_sp.AAC.1